MEDHLVHGSDEDMDEPLDLASDEEFSDDDVKHVHEEVLGVYISLISILIRKFLKLSADIWYYP